MDWEMLGIGVVALWKLSERLAIIVIILHFAIKFW